MKKPVVCLARKRQTNLYRKLSMIRNVYDTSAHSTESKFKIYQVRPRAGRSIVLQNQFDKQRFRFPVSHIVIYIFRPLLSVVQRRRFRQASHDDRDRRLLQRFSFRTTFTSYLKTGKGILLAANSSDRNAKLYILVGLC